MVYLHPKSIGSLHNRKLKNILGAKQMSSHIRGMNKLPLQKRVQILHMLVEGSSMWSISRVVGVSINTVTKLLENAGEACQAYHDEHVKGLKSKRIQCDEIWSFCYAKAKNVPIAKKAPVEAGDVWTWTTLDADSKLICNWVVGKRDSEYAMVLMDDLRPRLETRVQLTTDGHKAYLEAVEGAFGADIDYAMLVKLYGSPEGSQSTPERRYSPAVCTGARKMRIEGDPARAHVSTSYVEHSNLSMRMGMRRFTRLTNAHSKKLANHCHALALYFVYYNFVRIHSSLRMTPAMAAGVESHLWEMEDLVKLVDDAKPAAKKRGPYRKRNSI